YICSGLVRVFKEYTMYSAVKECCTKISWQILIIAWLVFVPTQLFAQNDSISLDGKSLSASADTHYQSVSSQEKVKVYVVKGTVITNLAENKMAEIIYIDQPSKKKSPKRKPQPAPKQGIAKPEKKTETASPEKP